MHQSTIILLALKSMINLMVISMHLSVPLELGAQLQEYQTISDKKIKIYISSWLTQKVLVSIIKSNIMCYLPNNKKKGIDLKTHLIL